MTPLIYDIRTVLEKEEETGEDEEGGKRTKRKKGRRLRRSRRIVHLIRIRSVSIEMNFGLTVHWSHLS